MKNITLRLFITFLLLGCANVFAQTASSTSSTVSTTTSAGAPSNNSTTTYSTTVSKTVNSHDADIVSAVYASYAKDAALTGTKLTVNSQNGVVSVSGTVTAQSQADEAVIAAKKVPGVKDVLSSINVITANPNATNQPPQTPNY